MRVFSYKMENCKMLPNKLPFFFEATKDKDNEGFPKVFPFCVYFDNELGMYRQSSSKNLNKLLRKAYLRGSMLSGGMNDFADGLQANSTFNFINKNFNLFNKYVLEVGCGDGYLLERLFQCGSICVGLEPGPYVKEIRNNFTIIQDFFPSQKIYNKFDLIIHFNVMEHIENPVMFLQKQKELLTKEGFIICGVPNCEADLATGDISIFRHEHFSYFSRYSLKKVAHKAGLSIEKIEIVANNGMIFAKMKPRATHERKYNFPFLSGRIFEAKTRSFCENILNFFSDENISKIAVYCPLRAMNILYASRVIDCRLVDDNESLHGKYLPTLSRRIENFEELKLNPPHKLFIYTRTFKDIIKKKCLEAEELSDTVIQTIR